MRFDSSKAFLQLTTQGIVATMRSNKNGYYYQGKKVLIKRGRRIVGRGVVVNIYPNTKLNREKLVRISGFTSVREWEEEARRLHGRLPDSIIVVKLLKLRSQLF